MGENLDVCWLRQRLCVSWQSRHAAKTNVCSSELDEARRFTDRLVLPTQLCMVGIDAILEVCSSDCYSYPSIWLQIREE